MEEQEDKLCGYEIKWNQNDNPKAPKYWIQEYKESEYSVINRNNFVDFVG